MRKRRIQQTEDNEDKSPQGKRRREGQEEERVAEEEDWTLRPKKRMRKNKQEINFMKNWLGKAKMAGCGTDDVIDMGVAKLDDPRGCSTDDETEMGVAILSRRVGKTRESF